MYKVTRKLMSYRLLARNLRFRAVSISFYFSYDHPLTTREAGPSDLGSGSDGDTNNSHPRPSDNGFGAISQTLPDNSLNGLGEYANTNGGAHLQQPFDFAFNSDCFGPNYIGLASEAEQYAATTLPAYQEPSYSVDVHGCSGCYHICLGHATGFMPDFELSINGGITNDRLRMIMVQNLDPLQTPINAADSPFGFHTSHAIHHPTEVRDFTNESNVDTQSFQLINPTDQSDSPVHLNQFDLEPQPLLASSQSLSLDGTAPEVTAEGSDAFQENLGQDSSVVRAEEPRPLLPLRSFSCSFCSRRFFQEESLRYVFIRCCMTCNVLQLTGRSVSI